MKRYGYVKDMIEHCTLLIDDPRTNVGVDRYVFMFGFLVRLCLEPTGLDDVVTPLLHCAINDGNWRGSLCP